VEGDSLGQREGVGQAILARGPGRRQPRLNVGAGIDVDQIVVDGVEDRDSLSDEAKAGSSWTGISQATRRVASAAPAAGAAPSSADGAVAAGAAGAVQEASAEAVVAEIPMSAA
jgi:hypothetical protein